MFLKVKIPEVDEPEPGGCDLHGTLEEVLRTEAGVLTTVGLQELVDHDEGLGDPLDHGVHLRVVGPAVHLQSEQGPPE